MVTTGSQPLDLLGELVGEPRQVGRKNGRKPGNRYRFRWGGDFLLTGPGLLTAAQFIHAGADVLVIPRGAPIRECRVEQVFQHAGPGRGIHYLSPDRIDSARILPANVAYRK